MPKGKGFRGVETVLGSVDGLKRFIEISPSARITVSTSARARSARCWPNRASEIYDVIRYFGSRKKIFNVHFRNIRGGFLQFQETFIDDGDVDMLKAMRVYKEVGFDGMMMPDHVPRDRRRHRRGAGLRVYIRLHQGADRRRQRGVVAPGWVGYFLAKRRRAQST